MKRPSCSLCERTGASCAYPTTRKSSRRQRKNTSRKQPDCANEVLGPEEGLSTHSWDALFDIAESPDAIYNQPLQGPTQTNQTFRLPDSSTNCQTTAETVNKNHSATSQDDGATLASTWSFPGVWQAEDVLPEAFADGTTPMIEYPSFASDVRDWGFDKEAGAQTPILEYLDVPPDSTVGHLPNLMGDLSRPFADETLISASVPSQNLQSSARSSLPVPESTADDL